ncbi:hypothetical protein G8C92_11200 [Paenibacillus donghaensis]|jgi:hypothetical protein|uniref:hypothetical protein n=1 Tax=Paenibacillus donghaensis TaxID=414771 RepID=UPI0018848E06|nr:hypothetical protein [Paenibacillus donghaensis]MBE9914598.1 hypothetical protein [Paenibacillus donghaensis]
MKDKNNRVIRGKFRLGENAFSSAKEKRERIMRDVERINSKFNSSKEMKGKGSECNVE